MQSVYTVSIIIPVYNCISWLEAVIQDILHQTYQDFEIIIIDDGSDDGSGLLCDRFKKMDKRIFVIHTEKLGVSHARNEGIKRAKGRYLWFVDADDRMDRESLSALVFPFLSQENVDLVIGKFENERNFWQSTLTGVLDQSSFIDDFSKCVHGFYYGALWNKLYKKEIIQNNNLWFPEDISWCEDYLFNLEYFSHLKRKVGYVSRSVYIYYTRENSLVTKVILDSRINVENRCLKRLGRFAEQNSRIQQAYEDHYAYLKHAQLINMYCAKQGYNKVKQICLNKEVMEFWKSYRNPGKFPVYRIISLLAAVNCSFLIYFFICLKEKIKIRLKKNVCFLRKIIRKPEYRN